MTSDVKTEPRLSHKRETTFSFTLHVNECISRRQTVGDQDGRC